VGEGVCEGAGVAVVTKSGSGEGVSVKTGVSDGGGSVTVGLAIYSGEVFAIVAGILGLHPLIKMTVTRKYRAIGFITPRLYPIPQAGD
jgi:hypothetical protein